jgi:DNA-binding NtrC family response regulator
LLVSHILRRLERNLGKHVALVDREILHALQRYDWPFNIRELGSR